jgi:hypothetical protein
MSKFAHGREFLDEGEADQKCLQALKSDPPVYSAAQVYALLSLEETLRKGIEGVIKELGMTRTRLGPMT